jgi:hypothetical protein
LEKSKLPSLKVRRIRTIAIETTYSSHLMILPFKLKEIFPEGDLLPMAIA